MIGGVYFGEYWPGRGVTVVDPAGLRRAVALDASTARVGIDVAGRRVHADAAGARTATAVGGARTYVDATGKRTVEEG